jgi:carbon-monoxide dehydrogenase small subunit
VADGDRLAPLQESLAEDGALQCGYCTPGMVMAARALLKSSPAPSDREIRYAMAGNLCRCTGYQQILDAVKRAATRK